MTNCLGSVISVDCGELGYYQGRLISLDTESKDIVLASAFKEGIPLGKNVTLNGAQIVSLKVLKAAHQAEPQVASTSSNCSEKRRIQKEKKVQTNGVMHRSKSTAECTNICNQENSRMANRLDSWETRPLAVVSNKSVFSSQMKACSLSSTSEEGQSTKAKESVKQSMKNRRVRRSDSDNTYGHPVTISETPRFRRFEPQIPSPKEMVMTKVKSRKNKGPSGNPLLDSKKLPGKIASGNNELVKPIDFDLLNTDFDFDANLEKFKKEDFDDEYYETVEKQKISQNFAHYENIVDDPNRCISWTNMVGKNGVYVRADTFNKSAARSSPVRSISFCPSNYETTYDGFSVPVLDVALKKKYLMECCARIGPDIYYNLVADRFIMWLIDVSGRLGITLDSIVVLAAESCPLRLIDRILLHLDNRGANISVYGKLCGSDCLSISLVDRASSLPSESRIVLVVTDDLATESQKWLRRQTSSHVVSLECCPNGVDYRRLHILMLGVLTSGIYRAHSKPQPQLGKTSFAELCAAVETNKFIDSAVCDIGAPFSWIAEEGKVCLMQAFSTTLMRRLC